MLMENARLDQSPVRDTMEPVSVPVLVAPPITTLPLPFNSHYPSYNHSPLTHTPPITTPFCIVLHSQLHIVHHRVATVSTQEVAVLEIVVDSIQI